jgi:cysteine-rich repeat protein
MRKLFLILLLGAGCNLLEVLSPSEPCGNSVIQAGLGEACDDGNRKNGDGCSKKCQIEFVCGDGDLTQNFDFNQDGVIDYNEECDDGDLNSDDAADACRTDCSAAHCGDGAVDTGELCDDGNLVEGDGCNSTCADNICGDGVVDGIEECDDGDLNSDFVPDACRVGCILPVCGDGVIDSGEQCDDANNLNDDFCSNSCTVSFCGDGFVQDDLQEKCDDGNDINGDGCQNTCIEAACGDGILDRFADPSGGVLEDCDDGNNIPLDGCNQACFFEFCGDGVTQSILGEICDDGNQTDGDNCESDCTPAACGNGILDEGEECDDGNLDVFDGCSTFCQIDLFVNCQSNINGNGTQSSPFNNLNSALNASLGGGQVIEIFPGSICPGVDITKSIGFAPFLDPTIHPDHRLDNGIPIIKSKGPGTASNLAAIHIPAGAAADTVIGLFLVQIGEETDNTAESAVVLESGALFTVSSFFVKKSSTRLPIIKLLNNTLAVISQSTITGNLTSFERFSQNQIGFESFITGNNVGIQCDDSSRVLIDRSILYGNPGSGIITSGSCQAIVSNSLILFNGNRVDQAGQGFATAEISEVSELAMVYNTFIENSKNLMNCNDQSEGTLDSSIATKTVLGVSVASFVSNNCNPVTSSKLNASGNDFSNNSFFLNENSSAVDNASDAPVALPFDDALFDLDVFQTDFNGVSRPFGGGPDMGAFESF